MGISIVDVADEFVGLFMARGLLDLVDLALDLADLASDLGN